MKQNHKSPTHWKELRLKDIVELNPDITESLDDAEQVSFLPMENVMSGYFINNQTKPFQEVKGAYTYFADGDIIMAKVSPCFENGNLSLVDDLYNGVGYGSTELICFRTKGYLNIRYLFFYLQHSSFIKWASSTMKGVAGLKRIDMRSLKDMTIFLPHIKEQSVIAEYLDRETARIDGIVERLRVQSERYEQLKRSLITETITQGLPDHDPSTFRNLRLKDVVSNHFSGDWGSDAESASEADVEAICVRIADFEYNKGVVKLDKETSTVRYYKPIILKEKSLRVNDLLVEKSGGGEKTPVGRVVIYDHQTEEPVMCANFMNVLRIKDFASPLWLLFYMKRAYHLGEVLPMIKQNTGLQNLSLKDFMNMSISLPPLDIQKEIVTYLNERCNKIDQLSEKISRKIELLEQLKKSLIEEVVTGQRPVKN